MKSFVLIIAGILGFTGICGPVLSHAKNIESTGDLQNLRILSGTETSIQLFPYMAAIFAWDKFICGGSIMASRYILTAAHCLYGYNYDDFTVSVGHSNYDAGEVMQVYSYYIHPDFSIETFENDLAVIKLRNNIDFSLNAQWIYLDKNKHDYGEATVTGWGETQYGSISKTLKVATVDVISNDQCTVDNFYWPPEYISDGMMCALDLEQHAQIVCPYAGDAGNPLVMTDFRGFKRQVGIASWGYYPCNTHKAAVYTRVSKYYDWITSKL